MIRVKSLDFLKKYPAIWNEDNWDDHIEIRNGKYYFRIPFDLVPSDWNVVHNGMTATQVRIPLIPPPDSGGSRHPVPLQSARVFRMIPPPLVGA